MWPQPSLIGRTRSAMVSGQHARLVAPLRLIASPRPQIYSTASSAARGQFLCRTRCHPVIPCRTRSLFSSPPPQQGHPRSAVHGLATLMRRVAAPMVMPLCLNLSVLTRFDELMNEIAAPNITVTGANRGLATSCPATSSSLTSLRLRHLVPYRTDSVVFCHISICILVEV